MNGSYLPFGSTPLAGVRQRSHRRASLAGWLIVAVGMLVVFMTAADYGVAWDDYVQSSYGQLCLDYFLSGGRNRTCNELLDLKYYSPAFEMLAAAAARLAPDRTIEMRHIVCGAAALFVVPPLVGFGRLLGRPWIGVIAAVALLLTPVFYGHAFVNSKDIPFAVGFTWSMYALAAMFALGRFSWGDVLACGVALGLTAAVRPGGWMLLGPLYVAAAIWFDWRSRVQGRPIRRSLLKQAAMGLVAWTIMVLPWPWAHENPVMHPVQAIRMAGQFHVVVPVLFEGKLLPSNELPRDYLLQYILLTMPPAVLLLATLGIAVAAARSCRRLNHPRTMVLLVAAAWLGLPLALFVALRPNTYDGLRHFLFLVPAIALWAAYGCHWLWSRLPAGARAGGMTAPRLAFAGLLLLAVAWQAQHLVRLHPYQMTYFNCLAGGVSQAADRYDTEVWLTSYKEAIEWIERQPSPRPGQSVHVLVAANDQSRWCADYFASPRLAITTTLTGGQAGDLPPGVDYYVGTSRCAMNRNFPLAPPVHHIQRAGAIFTTIRRSGRQEQVTETR